MRNPKRPKFVSQDPIGKIVTAACAGVSETIRENGFPFAMPAESPIEETFGTAVSAYLRYVELGDRHLSTYPPDQLDRRCVELAEDETHMDDWIILGSNQYHIENVRVDFIFAHKNWRTGKVFRLVVECDGHDFHERTKDQAARDRSRDRMFQGKGYGVFRFTGSEIWRDPIGCARQVIEWLDQKSGEKP